MDKMHRQKVAEVEKLTQTVRELEEAVLAGGAAANAVRDYQRKVQEMNVNAHFFFPFYLLSDNCPFFFLFPCNLIPNHKHHGLLTVCSGNGLCRSIQYLELL